MEEINKKTPFWDTKLTVDERIDWLLSEMTIEEKLSWLPTGVPDLERLGIPGCCVGGEAAHGVEARNDQFGINLPPEPTTSFPQPIGMSASWDPELVRQGGAVIGTEARVVAGRIPKRGICRWAPTIDLERDPRWGRSEEAYGEDPYLTGEMASAYVRGMQGDDPEHLRAACTLKHFYANNTENGRGFKSSSIDPRNKYELYLEPFRRVIEKGGAEAVMTAYNRVNGVPGMLNDDVQHILKDQYGLKHAVCDGGATEQVVVTHHYYASHADTIARALKAGVDGFSDPAELVVPAAREAFERGMMTEEQIDRAIRHVLGTKIRLGLYDADPVNPYAHVTEADMHTEAAQAVCRQLSREVVTLLKNDNRMLPLSPEAADDIAVIGPLADRWDQDWYGGEPHHRISLIQGLNNLYPRIGDCTDGWDRVTFTCDGQGVRIREDGRLCLGEEADIFIKEDWGWGDFTFRSVRTGLYMNTRRPDAWKSQETRDQIAVEKAAAFDWYVMELFHIEQLENGHVILKSRFGVPLTVEDDGTFLASETGEPAELTMTVVENGIEKARAAAGKKKIVILALGSHPMIGAKEEIDRRTISLPPVQEALLEAVFKVNPNVVLVLLSNYPYAIVQAQEKVPAILWSATGSQDMGTALAETLFGFSSPSGRLDMTWYRSDDQLPDIDDYDIIRGGRTYRYFEGEVLYPFGHGLTYTSFRYDHLEAELEDEKTIRIQAAITNTGNLVSDEVVQIYGTAPQSRVKKPIRQLIGFERVKQIAPGESRDVILHISTEEFRFYDVISRSLMIEEGLYRIQAGRSSGDIRLEKALLIPGQKTGKRSVRETTQADHFDDIRNIILTEGDGDGDAVTCLDPSRPAELVYRDWEKEAVRGIVLELQSRTGGRVCVLADGKEMISCSGKTEGKLKVELPMQGGFENLTLKLTGDIRIFRFFFTI